MTTKCTWHFDYFDNGILDGILDGISGRTYILHADCLNVTIEYLGLPVYELCFNCGKPIKYEFPDDDDREVKE